MRSPQAPKSSTEGRQQVRRGRPRSEELHRAILAAAIAQVLEFGFRSISIESIAAASGVGKPTIYRRWPNKAAVVMDAFMQRVGSETLFSQTDDFSTSVRLQLRSMAKAFGGKDGVLLKALLAEAQFDAELAKAFSERWTTPRRQMALTFFRQGVLSGVLRDDVDLDAAIDMLYAPLYYRLQMRTGPLSGEYIDKLFSQAMEGLLRRDS